MKRIFSNLVLTLFSGFAISLSAQDYDDVDYHISSFEFESIFGTNPTHPNATYCLLGRGFFQTDTSANLDKLIDDWLASHPFAEVIPVAAIVNFDDTTPDSKFIYCWVVQDVDTLNTHLVRNGAIPGATMVRPEITADESGDKGRIELIIGITAYTEFLEKVKKAEAEAFQNRRGVWKAFQNKK